MTTDESNSSNYQDQLKIVKAADDQLRSQGRNLATEFEARATSGHIYYDTNFGRLELRLLSQRHNNERDWPARTITDAQNAEGAAKMTTERIAGQTQTESEGGPTAGDVAGDAAKGIGELGVTPVMPPQPAADRSGEPQIQS